MPDCSLLLPFSFSSPPSPPPLFLLLLLLLLFLFSSSTPPIRPSVRDDVCPLILRSLPPPPLTLTFTSLGLELYCRSRYIPPEPGHPSTQTASTTGRQTHPFARLDVAVINVWTQSGEKKGRGFTTDSVETVEISSRIYRAKPGEKGDRC